MQGSVKQSYMRSRLALLPVHAGAGWRLKCWRAMSCGQVDSHTKWLNDVVAHCENNVTIDFPIIADPTREVAVKCAPLLPDPACSHFIC